MNKFDMAATPALRDEMQDVRRSVWLFHLRDRATQQFARKALSRKGCSPTPRLRRQALWHRSHGYDLHRLPCKHHDWGCNATHGRLIHRFLNLFYL